MSFTRDWNNGDPVNHTLNRNWPTEIRDVKVDIEDRLKSMLNGFIAGETDVGLKKLTFIAQVSAPITVTDQIQIYAKVVSTKTELFLKSEDGVELQITAGGRLFAAGKKEIKMYGGLAANIATDFPGFQLCDGSNSVPDLRDKFVICAKQDDSGAAKTNVTGSLTQSGGAATHDHGGVTGSHTLSESEIPSHVHPCTMYNGNGGGTAGFQESGTQSPGSGGQNTGATGGGGGHTHTLTSASSLGPYYALCMITRTVDWA